MAELVIIGHPVSNFLRTVRMACEEKGIAYDLDYFTQFDVRSEEHRALHPWSKTPILRHNNRVLWETSAIVRYIDAVFDGPPLQPADPEQRAGMDQWISAVCSYVDIDIIRNWLVNVRFGDMENPETQAIVSAAKERVPHDLDALEAGYGGRDFLVGDTLTLADLFIAPILHYVSLAPEGRQMIDDRPNVTRALAVIEQRPSFLATTPDER